jgi:hypothetical protein
MALVVLGGALAVVPRAVAEATPGSVFEATPEAAVRWERYDVTLDVGPDGAIAVTEAQVVAFRGTFGKGFANIPLREGERIDDVRLSVGVGANSTPEPLRQVPVDRYREDVGTFTFAERQDVVEIDYAFEPTRQGDDAGANTRLIVLRYTIHGAIRAVGTAGAPQQEIWWTAISADVTTLAPVRQASVSISLPEAVPIGEASAEPTWDEADGQVFTWRAATLGSGDALEVRLRFPAIIGEATPAARIDPARMPGPGASEMRY